MERHGRDGRGVAHQRRAERRARGGGEAPHRIAGARVQSLAIGGLIRERRGRGQRDERETISRGRRLKSPARRRECVVACRLGGVAKRETRGGGRCGSSEIPTHHRVRSLCEGPSGFVPVDGIRDIRRPFFRHRGGKRAGLFHVDSGALDTARRRRSFAELVMCANQFSRRRCAPCARRGGDSRESVESAVRRALARFRTLQQRA